MTCVRVLVLRAPGTNCHEETAHAFRLAGAAPEPIHVNRLLEAPAILDEFQILCLPGGFSFGDDLGAGTILANVLKRGLGDQLAAFRDRDRLILGVCNGFQVLLRAGLLVAPDPKSQHPRATLTLNAHGRFEDRWVHLRVTRGRCVFLDSQEQRWTMPIAHAEGSFLVSASEVLGELEANGQIVCRYVDAEGEPGGFPVNPNGSMGDVAGLCDATGRVFALMPHPERHVAPWHHPQWTRHKELPPEGDGLQLFRQMVRYFA